MSGLVGAILLIAVLFSKSSFNRGAAIVFAWVLLIDFVTRMVLR